MTLNDTAVLNLPNLFLSHTASVAVWTRRQTFRHESFYSSPAGNKRYAEFDCVHFLGWYRSHVVTVKCEGKALFRTGRSFMFPEYHPV